MERVPIWICARSGLAHDIGHFWPLLARFERVELRPFRFSETNALLAVMIGSGQIPSSVKPFARQLHRLSGGLPLALVELLEQFAARPYDLSRRASLRLLELDRRIKNLGSAAASAAVRRALAPNISQTTQTNRRIPRHGDADDGGIVGCARGGRAPRSIA